jgi:hypothetical protein
VKLVYIIFGIGIIFGLRFASWGRAFTSASLANCNICRLPVAPFGRFLSQQIYCNCLRAGFPGRRASFFMAGRRSIPGAKSPILVNKIIPTL